MKFEAITIKDIARALGLSTSTVSRALRDSYEISTETKKTVMEYATEHNYRPNPIALSLKEKRSRSIGVIVCEIANSYFSQVINGIESVAYQKGYNVIISQSHESYEREVNDLDYLTSRSIDGLLISVSSETTNMSHLQALHKRGFPIVFFDRITDEIITHKVIADNFQGAYNATQHLINRGYKNIAALANAEHLSIAQERLKGYRQAMADNDLPVNNNSIMYCNHGGVIFSEVQKAVKELYKTKLKPDAILGLSDKLTTGCLKALNAKGMNIPEDVGLIGFSNSDLTDLLNPSLSVIKQPAFEMGEISTELLLQLIESKRPVKEFETKVLDTELIIRESSAKRKR
ncbi:MAG: LacI family DNA-binding transcriptional regulator [Ferruginibacter sp.]